MNTFRQIRLELLRHGPPRNQLLSPLTQYLALCGNHAATTVEIPLEHAAFVAKLQALQYKDSDLTRSLQLAESAELMTQILQQVPGLIAELKNCCFAGKTSGFGHLELVLSASELALLPFELAKSPSGCPGEGQTLVLQPDSPLSLTRRIRRIDRCQFEWPRIPRVLFAYTSFPDMPVPDDAHVAALMTAVRPWIRNHDESSREAIVKAYSPLLHVLPYASADAIQKAVAAHHYTHIHLLAHGEKYQEGVDTRYGLKLHGRRAGDDADVVSGDRLASLLQTASAGTASELVRPAVVTIASCEGAQGGTVFGPGSSVAHALHEAGIPLVVAAQFPLSFAGSVIMVETLYDGLLRGQDPRALLRKLRCDLHAKVPTSHDWASIVAYASLPDNFDAQLAEARHAQARRQIEIAFDDYDNEPNGKHATTIHRKLREGLAQLDTVLNFDGLPPESQRDIRGLMAATYKRQAEIVRKSETNGPDTTRDKADDRLESHALLRKACEQYRAVYKCDVSASWAIVQELFVEYYETTQSRRESDASPPIEQSERWQLAELLSLRDLQGIEFDQRVFAMGNLIELRLLAILARTDEQTLQRLSSEVDGYVAQLLRLGELTAPSVKATIRQLVRFKKWFESHPYIQDVITRLSPLTPACVAIGIDYSTGI